VNQQQRATTEHTNRFTCGDIMNVLLSEKTNADERRDAQSDLKSQRVIRDRGVSEKKTKTIEHREEESEENINDGGSRELILW
jgi:flagellar basal body L-ring protein FlgH